jgi:hypothetical protein
MIGLAGGPRKCGNDWTWGIFGGDKDRRRVEREKCPREHRKFSQIIASLSIVLCSTGAILRRKGNGDGSEVESSNGRRVRERKKEKKADPFQNRKDRAPSLFEFQARIEFSVFSGFARPEKNLADSVGHPPCTD